MTLNIGFEFESSIECKNGIYQQLIEDHQKDGFKITNDNYIEEYVTYPSEAINAIENVINAHKKMFERSKCRSIKNFAPQATIDIPLDKIKTLVHKLTTNESRTFSLLLKYQSIWTTTNNHLNKLINNGKSESNKKEAAISNLTKAEELIEKNIKTLNDKKWDKEIVEKYHIRVDEFIKKNPNLRYQGKEFYYLTDDGANTTFSFINKKLDEKLKEISKNKSEEEINEESKQQENNKMIIPDSVKGLLYLLAYHSMPAFLSKGSCSTFNIEYSKSAFPILCRTDLIEISKKLDKNILAEVSTLIEDWFKASNEINADELKEIHLFSRPYKIDVNDEQKKEILKKIAKIKPGYGKECMNNNYINRIKEHTTNETGLVSFGPLLTDWIDEILKGENNDSWSHKYAQAYYNIIDKNENEYRARKDLLGKGSACYSSQSLSFNISPDSVGCVAIELRQPTNINGIIIPGFDKVLERCDINLWLVYASGLISIWNEVKEEMKHK